MFIKRVLSNGEKIFNKVLQNKRRSSNLASIFALTTGSNQRSAVAVFRISGSKCIETIEILTKKKCENIEPRKMYLRDIYHPITRDKIDKSLFVWFKAPNSFTGEDVCEFHVHGGPAVISSMYSCLANIEGVRQAEPGEFSKRAFVNGKMDLTEVEGLADLINAETEMQRKLALNQMEGSLSKLYSSWKEEIIKSLANVEAFIDFHEEENIEDDILQQGFNFIYLIV